MKNTSGAFTPAGNRAMNRARSGPAGRPVQALGALTRHSPGARLELEVQFPDGRKHLPLVTIKRAA